MKKVYLIRHGETESNRKGIFRGRLDIPLSQRGKEQARALTNYFENIPVDKVYCSPLQRAMDTAKIAFPNIQSIEEPSLNNLDLGKWSGMDKSLVREQFPGQWEIWVTRPESICFPDGERLADVYRRAQDFFEKIGQSNEETIVAVSHRSVAKVMMAAAIGLKENYFWKFHLDNASVSILYFEESRGWTIVKANDTHHLQDTVMEWY